MISRTLVALIFLIKFLSIAKSEETLKYCHEKIRLEQEAVQLALDKHQQALDRYLAFVKKQEDSGWVGISAKRKQQILDDIAFFRQPIEDLKKTEFTQESGCLKQSQLNSGRHEPLSSIRPAICKVAYRYSKSCQTGKAKPLPSFGPLSKQRRIISKTAASTSPTTAGQLRPRVHRVSMCFRNHKKEEISRNRSFGN